MKSEHILDILDEKSFGEFDEVERRLIDAHTLACGECRRSYDIARMSSAMLKTSVSQNFEPTPCFTKRVLANLPEVPKSVGSIWAFAKLWKASGKLVGAMVAVVFVLAALTLLAPETESSVTIENDPDMVILDRKMPTKDLNNEQIFQIIYGTESGKNK